MLQETYSTSPTLQPVGVTKSEEQEYDFVDDLSEDFLCPVTLGLLLEPELTTCCGQHLSKQAATKLKGKACPLCKDENLVTVFSKFHRRRVRELQVFCTNKDRGCHWEGELGNLNNHIEKSCEKKDSPLVEIKKVLISPCNSALVYLVISCSTRSYTAHIHAKSFQQQHVQCLFTTENPKTVARIRDIHM